jgi:tRNA modification GTPase
MSDTIFALSSGAPPAAIAVIRVSGPQAGHALATLADRLPKPRVATLRELRSPDGEQLDRALTLWFPGPQTATGEDLAELHLHGGRAVVLAVETALLTIPGVRQALPGEFTRRAFANGRIDLAEAEGLADLLTAETELQRRQALSMASGTFSTQVRDWRTSVLAISARVEALLDFADEDDVEQLPQGIVDALDALIKELQASLQTPRAEILRDGFRVVLAGPPNSGKSSLFNYLVENEAAITAPVAGTTRDVLTLPVSLSGVPFVFVDTAGLRLDPSDAIEAIGIDRAQTAIREADLVLWLGAEGQGAGKLVWEIESFADLNRWPANPSARHRVSTKSGTGMKDLCEDLVQVARGAMPSSNAVALNRRQHELIDDAHASLSSSRSESDLLIVGESLRVARLAFDRLLGHASTEDMLDALFGRFCIGK